MSTPDPLLQRIEKRALVLTAVAAAVAGFVPGGGWRAAAGVVGGALVAGTSYWAIKRGVVSLADAILAGDARMPKARTFLALVGRYALLAVMAYVMIARLRLHPLGLLGGASVIVAAAAVELVRGRT